MSVFTALYNLFVGPLELFFEILFSIANRVIENPGLSIIFLSLAMNFLVLPLYKRADAMQAEERDLELRLKPWVTHIKKTFKGDERFMMLQTFYRQNNYKPTYALKGSVSLLLEVPFFIAAYNFLSELELLNGFKFGPITDLGAPDGLLVIGGVAINLLPILMTVINIISSAIYTKGLPAKSKITLYGMAAIFLVLLYTSPAGLVFYWTLNNLFSLVKNVFYKLKNPKLVLCILSTIASTALLIYTIFVNPIADTRKQIFTIVFLALFQLPLVFYFIEKNAKKTKAAPAPITKKEKVTFFLGTIFVALITGLLIPVTLVHASPEEFINTVNVINPLLYILNSSLFAVGTFVIWFGIFYMLASDSGKRVMSLAVWLLAGCGTIDYMFFGKNFGNMSSTLRYDVAPLFPIKAQLINLAVLLVAAAVLYLIWKKKEELVRVVYIAAGFALIGMSIFNISQINGVITGKIDQLEEHSKDSANITLSKDGNNVVVIMLDRAISSYVPYMMEEKPILKEQFAGFTYYPNTMSYGGFTNTGSPALYGGYEYTPIEQNKRDKLSLKDKQNEALTVMPVLFDQNGFEVTVCDPTYANYNWNPDLSIYDKYPDIHKYNTMGYFDPQAVPTAEKIDEKLRRDFFCYSLFKIAPTFAQPTLYNNGLYNKSVAEEEKSEGSVQQTCEGLSKATGMYYGFTRSYAVLENFPSITHIAKNNNENTFFMISNDTTHEPMLLQAPDYVPSEIVDNTAYDETHTDRFTLNGKTARMDEEIQITHYHANMAAFLQLGEWFDYLRENDLYDNTRIIIVSDHGRNLKSFENMIFGDKYNQDAMLFNPLLIVKDFGATEFTTNMQFMTNADVPTLAVSGLIENPVNPNTNKPLNNAAKNPNEEYIFFSEHWDINENNGNVYMPGEWYRIHDNVLDKNNWEIVAENATFPN